MLTNEDNELMCRVGPGTPMGEMMRQYWLPALMSSELPSPDCPPLRIRLLGENLIAFRTTSGAVGLVKDACPHRGASLFFGRNEEEGLRCVYHGWKFDVSGACVDMPSEPAESNFKSKVRATAYPCNERNGAIWAYMGPRELPPRMPELPPNLEEDCIVSERMSRCNFMQALEGDIDTVHAGFLHSGHAIAERDHSPGGVGYYASKVRQAKFVTREHAIGATYAAVRPAEEGTDYWRTGHFILPFFTMNAPGVLPLKNYCNAWVPLDDSHTMVWNFQTRAQNAFEQDPESSGIGGLKVGARLTADPRSPSNPYTNTRRANAFLPPTSDWLGRFRAIADSENDYYIDRDLQRNVEWDPAKPPTGTYSGIPSIESQDRAMQESMGGIYERSHEHLGTTDSMVILARRKLIKVARALRDQGVVPPGVDNPELFRMRSGGAILPHGVDGLEVLKPVHFMQAEVIAPIPIA